MDRGSDVRRRPRLPISAVLVVLVIATFGVVLIRGPLTTLNELQTLSWPHRFDAQAWRDHPDERYWMAVDLVSSGALRGKSAAWLRGSLGTPASGRSGEMSWDVPSPQRPEDKLIIAVREGVVAGWKLTPDPEGSPWSH